MTAVLLYTTFFASGASALLFETLWFRQAGLAFGNSVSASSVVLSAFMAGLAIGNGAAARWGNRATSPLRLYAAAEAATAAGGVGLVLLLPLLGGAIAPVVRPLLDHPWLVNVVRFLAAFLLLLIPSTAMGLTLPVLARTLMRWDTSFGGALGRLYGWNTLGAMAGVVVGDAYLLPAFGVRGTALAAGSLNLLAAVVAMRLATSEPPVTPLPASSGSTRPTRRPAGSSTPDARTRRVGEAITGWRAGGRWIGAAFLAGLVLLALEVVWFRFLLLFIKGHSGAFPVMLGIVLAGIALGGLGASVWLRRRPDAHAMAAPVACAAGVSCIAAYALFPTAIHPLARATIATMPQIARVGVPLMFPTSFLSGVAFTMVGAALGGRLRSDIEATGVLTLANTAGAAAGALVGGFVLLPVLGIERSLWVLAALYGGVALLVADTGRRTMAIGGASILVAGLALFPFGLLTDRLLPIPLARWAPVESERRLVAVREGLTETVIYFERLMAARPVSQVMLTNSFSMSTNGYGVRRYQKLYVYWPMAVHPGPRRALLIGYGVGNTAKAMTDSPGLETIDIVDLSRDILSLGRIPFPHEADQPLRDPRVRVHIEDGRNFLQTTVGRFDLITGEPPPPGIAGVEPLYSREYFQLLHDRLADGGIATYWLPLSDLTDVSALAILRAFCDAFDDCSLWNGSGTNLMMVGTRGARGPVSAEQFAHQWNAPGVAAEMSRLGVETPGQLGALFIGDAEYLRGLTAHARALTDDDPKLIDAPFSSADAGRRLFGGFVNVEEARSRFVRSPLIARLWPPGWRAGSLPYFEFQGVINAHFYGDLVQSAPAIEDVHSMLTRSSLVTPVEWRLASNADIQRVVDDGGPDALDDPALQFHLGIRLLAERHYAAAAEAFGRAEAVKTTSDNAFAMHVYALCMAGQVREAEAMTLAPFAASLRARGLAPGAVTEASLPPFWQWMKRTFGIDPTRK